MNGLFREIIETIYPDIKRMYEECDESREALRMGEVVEELGEPYEPHPDEHLRWCRL